MEPLRKISLSEKFASFDDCWSPKTLATVGDYAVKGRQSRRRVRVA